MKKTLIITALTLTLSAVAENAEAHLIAHWQLDEGIGNIVKDSSGNNHNGEIFKLGEYAKWVPGKYGYALNFPSTEEKGGNNSGSGYVLFKNMPTEFPKGLTINTWIKLNESCNKEKFRGVGFHEIVSNAKTHIGPGFSFTLFYKSLLFRSGNGKEYQNAMSNRELTEIPNEIWLNIVAVYDPEKSTSTVYLNGMKVGENKEQFELTKGLDSWTVGAFLAGYVPLDGAIDEMKIYDFPMSASAILEYYNKNR